MTSPRPPERRRRAATAAPVVDPHDEAAEDAATGPIRTSGSASSRRAGGFPDAERQRGRQADNPSPARSHAQGHADGHGHGRGGGGVEGASAQRVRRLLALLLVPCAVAVLAGLVLLAPSPAEFRQVAEQGRFGQGGQGLGAQTPVDAQVVRAAGEADCTDPNLPSRGAGEGCLAVTVLLDEGPAAGRTITTLSPATPDSPRFAVGDAVVLGWAGGDPTDPVTYTIVDFQRGPPLLVLGGLFALAVLLLGRCRDSPRSWRSA
jgi:hypothetical protein